MVFMLKFLEGNIWCLLLSLQCIRKKKMNGGVSAVVQLLKNLISFHEVAGSIPGSFSLATDSQESHCSLPLLHLVLSRRPPEGVPRASEPSAVRPSRAVGPEAISQAVSFFRHLFYIHDKLAHYFIFTWGQQWEYHFFHGWCFLNIWAASFMSFCLYLLDKMS